MALKFIPDILRRILRSNLTPDELQILEVIMKDFGVFSEVTFNEDVPWTARRAFLNNKREFSRLPCAEISITETNAKMKSDTGEDIFWRTSGRRYIVVYDNKAIDVVPYNKSCTTLDENIKERDGVSVKDFLLLKGREAVSKVRYIIREDWYGENIVESDNMFPHSNFIFLRIEGLWTKLG